MKDICIYSSDGRADLTQADEIKSFLKDILYNFTLKRRRPSPNILKPGCLLSRPGKWWKKKRRYTPFRKQPLFYPRAKRLKPWKTRLSSFVLRDICMRLLNQLLLNIYFLAVHFGGRLDQELPVGGHIMLT